MSERRSLVEGVKPTEINPDLARQFIKHGMIDPLAASPATASRAKPSADEARPATLGGARRVALTTRLRPDLAEALKRAALQRELEGAVPYSQQEIIEEALEPWLRQHGYLSL